MNHFLGFMDSSPWSTLRFSPLNRPLGDLCIGAHLQLSSGHKIPLSFHEILVEIGIPRGLLSCPNVFVFQFFIPQLIINIHQPTGRPVKHTILNWAMGWSITSNELSRTRRSAIRWNEPAKDVGPLIQPRCEPWCWNIYIYLYIYIFTYKTGPYV